MFDFEVIRSRRKTVSAEFLSESRLLVRAPLYMSDREIEKCLRDNERLLLKRLEKFLAAQRIRLSAEEIALLKKVANEKILPRAHEISKLVGLPFHSAKITSAKKRFGSCSSEKKLCFSFYLAAYPDELIDYVIVHELCHTIEMNHSPSFYKLLSSLMPDWKERQKALRSKKYF